MFLESREERMMSISDKMKLSDAKRKTIAALERSLDAKKKKLRVEEQIFADDPSRSLASNKTYLYYKEQLATIELAYERRREALEQEFAKKLKFYEDAIESLKAKMTDEKPTGKVYRRLALEVAEEQKEYDMLTAELKEMDATLGNPGKTRMTISEMPKTEKQVAPPSRPPEKKEGGGESPPPKISETPPADPSSRKNSISTENPETEKPECPVFSKLLSIPCEEMADEKNQKLFDALSFEKQMELMEMKKRQFQVAQEPEAAPEPPPAPPAPPAAPKFAFQPKKVAPRAPLVSETFQPPPEHPPILETTRTRPKFAVKRLTNPLLA